MKTNDISLAEPIVEQETAHHTPHAGLVAEVIHELKHYLPAQAPLKDFIHHNTLHAFQNLKFSTALHKASEILGYNVSLSVTEYRNLYEKHRIREDVLDKVILQRMSGEFYKEWKHKLLYTEYRNTTLPRIGTLRAGWKKSYRIDLDALVHSTIFRITCSYLDQGIAIWNFPVWNKEFLTSVREVERNSFSSFFRTKRARRFLLDNNKTLDDLLEIVVGDRSLWKQYLFDQQFAHQGWSGMVSQVEDQPQTLLDTKKISLKEFITLELLLEIDALDYQFGKNWKPLSEILTGRPKDLFAPLPPSELHQVLTLWQEAFEWSYYDQVLAAIATPENPKKVNTGTTFQAMFCIDDRECSFRRYLEQVDGHCETFSTPGFFGSEFFFKAAHGKFYTKLCPAPVTPKYLIKELDVKKKDQKDLHFTKHSHKLFRGWLITQTLGFWSAFKLFVSIFKPAASPATATSFSHMDRASKLTIEHVPGDHENNLQVGYTIEEMADRAENLLRSIGLVKNFASLIYVVGHGSSSVNNPHYAAYDCGACSGRPGSVNARVFSYMANHKKVREILRPRGIDIPETTHFTGGLHDTSRDEVAFYDEERLTGEHRIQHEKNTQVFHRALQLNAKERSRRFDSINTRMDAKKIHDQVKIRSVSLFEPRPELNHATNALCIVGRRSLTKNVFLDRRAFMNSYDYKIDPDGKYLLNILKAAAPVCGGINLEYFFSRVDNQKLGAGTKLPHNVIGLFGVANGIEGDLRPGLPSQMIEVHDPIRLMIIVEHFHDVVLETIQRHAETYEWFKNSWVHLVTVNPETSALHVFEEGIFSEYRPLQPLVRQTTSVTSLIEESEQNIPVHLIS
jgi:uncharacterized protein YbcC (UPF0753/DUF2309 family)